MNRPKTVSCLKEHLFFVHIIVWDHPEGQIVFLEVIQGIKHFHVVLYHALEMPYHMHLPEEESEHGGTLTLLNVLAQNWYISTHTPLEKLAG